MVLLVNIFKMEPKELCIQSLVVILLAKSTFGTPAVDIMNFQRAMIASVGNCNVDGCDISCVRGDDSFLYSDIRLAQTKKNVDCGEVNELQLKRYHFHDKTIPHNWNPVVFKIRKLKIERSDVEFIKFGAFQLYNFNELFLDNLIIKNLDNGALAGLTTLKSLKVIQDKPIQFISRDLLKPVQFNLVELQFSAGLTSLDIITGCCTSFDALKTVDFSFNKFGKISSETFKKFSSIEDLNLSHSGILHLERGAFGFPASLRNLDLSYNHLSIISSSIFYPNRNLVNVHFRLNDNNWTCCCKFQVFIKHSLVHEPDKILCRAPSQYNGLPLLKLQCLAYGVMGQMAPENHLQLPPVISTTTGSALDQTSARNTFMSPASTIQITNGTFSQTPAWDNSDEKNMVLKCIVCNGTSCTKSENTEYNRVRVKPRSLDFTITPLTSFSVTVGVKTTIEDPFALIWFNRATKEFFKMEINYKEYGLGCLRNISQTIVVDELTANETYTFCIVHMEYPLTSPFNCMAYRSSYPYQAKANVWLSQGMKNLCISLTILVILSSIVLGGSVMYCVIKKKPTLLRGSKRVIMPKKSSEDIMVLPRCGSLSKESKGVENSAFVLNRCLHLRRSSNASVDSSYVSPNLYESIPAVENKSSKKRNEIVSLCSTVSPGVKRTSNDPLPSIPNEGCSELEFKENRCSASTA